MSQLFIDSCILLLSLLLMSQLFIDNVRYSLSSTHIDYFP